MAMTAMSSGLRCASAVELSNNAASAAGSRAVAVRAVGSNPNIKSPDGGAFVLRVGRGASGHSPLSKWVYCYTCQAPKGAGGNKLLPPGKSPGKRSNAGEKMWPGGMRKRLPNEVYHSFPLQAFGHVLKCPWRGR